MNSIVRLSFKKKYLLKFVLMGLVNSAQNPHRKSNASTNANAIISTLTLIVLIMMIGIILSLYEFIITIYFIYIYISQACYFNNNAIIRYNFFFFSFFY